MDALILAAQLQYYKGFYDHHFRMKINVLKVVMLKYELITGEKRERPPGSGRMRQHVLRVVVISSYWQSL